MIALLIPYGIGFAILCFEGGVEAADYFDSGCNDIEAAHNSLMCFKSALIWPLVAVCYIVAGAFKGLRALCRMYRAVKQDRIDKELLCSD